MALKLKINKAAYDKLGDELKKEYKADGEEFSLDVDGIEDTSGLKTALENERKNNKTHKARIAELELEVDEVKSAGGADQAKLDAAVAKANAKSQKTIDELTTKLTGRDAKLTQVMGDNVAVGIASKLSTAPSVMLPHIKSRIKVDLESDEPLTVFLDKDGKPNNKLTAADIEKEFLANPDFKGILKASQANGGGTPTPAPRPGGMPTNEAGKPVNFGAMKGKELAAHLASKKEQAA